MWFYVVLFYLTHLISKLLVAKFILSLSLELFWTRSVDLLILLVCCTVRCQLSEHFGTHSVHNSEYFG